MAVVLLLFPPPVDEAAVIENVVLPPPDFEFEFDAFAVGDTVLDDPVGVADAVS